MQEDNVIDAEGYFKLPFAVMKLTGNVGKFNQGVMTNTLGTGRNAFIDIYGKIVAVFYQKFLGGELYLAFNEKYAQTLQAHLFTYLKIGKAKLEPAGLDAYFVSGKIMGYDTGGGGIKIPEKDGYVLLSQNPPADIREMSKREFDIFRLEQGISMQGTEFGHDMIMNTDWQDAVSLSKGCFLGQEIAVKVTQRGRPPKRLVRIAFESEPQKATRDQFEVGEVRSKCFSQKLGKWIAYCSIPNDGLGVDGGTILP